MTKTILKVNGKDITSFVGSITLDSSIDTLGDKVQFDMAFSRYLYKEIYVGDKVQLLDDKTEVFRGIVVTKTRDENTQSFVCFDYAFYLNKSKVIKQFKKVRTDTAIRQLLSEFNVPVGTIAPIGTIVTKIFYDKEVSEVIKSLLEDAEKTSKKRYFMEMNKGKLDIYPSSQKVVKAMVRLADNVAFINCMDTISNPSKTVSIEDMKNSIKIYVGDEKKVKVCATAKNDMLIQKYGLLQETQPLEEKNIAEAKHIAANMLKEFGKISTTAGITVVGNYQLRAGRVVEVNEPITNIVGKYLIKTATHNIGQSHTTVLGMEEV